MKEKTTVTLYQKDILELIQKHLESLNYKMTGEVDIHISDTTKIPKGATPGDKISIVIEVS